MLTSGFMGKTEGMTQSLFEGADDEGCLNIGTRPQSQKPHVCEERVERGRHLSSDVARSFARHSLNAEPNPWKENDADVGPEIAYWQGAIKPDLGHAASLPLLEGMKRGLLEQFQTSSKKVRQGLGLALGHLAGCIYEPYEEGVLAAALISRHLLVRSSSYPTPGVPTKSIVDHSNFTKIGHVRFGENSIVHRILKLENPTPSILEEICGVQQGALREMSLQRLTGAIAEAHFTAPGTKLPQLSRKILSLITDFNDEQGGVMFVSVPSGTMLANLKQTLFGHPELPENVILSALVGNQRGKSLQAEPGKMQVCLLADTKTEGCAPVLEGYIGKPQYHFEVTRKGIFSPYTDWPILHTPITIRLSLQSKH